MTHPPAGLAALEARLADELAFLQLPAPRWTPVREHDGQPVLDVAIIGAGMTGLACAAALVQRGMSVVAFDEAPAGLEGPWATTARMETLRSPKQLAGPALGIPSLTFRAWFEAQFGRAEWDALDKIPRLQWMDYLRWYRRVLALPVRNGHRVTDLVPHGNAEPAKATTMRPARRARASRPTAARRASGPAASCSRPAAPASAARRCPPSPKRCRARAGPIRPTTTTTPRCAGLRVGVVGAGASAMDSAATALEAGAAQRAPAGAPRRPAAHQQGQGRRQPRLRRRLRAPAGRMEMAHPPLHQRPAGAAAAQQHAARLAPPERALPPRRRDRGRGDERDGALQVRTSAGPIELDFLIFATGFKVDWRQRPMLRRIAPCIRIWKDRYTPPAGQDDDELAESPDLGPAFEFQPRAGAHCPGLDRVHCL